MSDTITIGRRILPVEQIVLVEPYEASSNQRVQSEKQFKSRVVLIDRESVLAEFEPFAFAEQNGFRMLLEDNAAVSPNVKFWIETFEPAEGFNPTKPYKTRLTWRDGDNVQSKLLVTAPEIALAVTVRGEVLKPASTSETPPDQPDAQRRSRRRPVAAPGPA